MNPEDWGWHVIGGRFMPIMTDQPAGPPELLDVVCCSCKKDFSMKRCTCINMDSLALPYAENVVTRTILPPPYSDTDTRAFSQKNDAGFLK